MSLKLKSSGDNRTVSTIQSCIPRQIANTSSETGFSIFSFLDAGNPELPRRVGVIASAFHQNRALHASEPLRHGSRVESHASSHPERRNPSRCGMLEDRDRRNVEQRRNLLCGQGAPDLLDLICDRHSPVQSALLVFPPGSAWAEFVTVDPSPVTLGRGRVHSDNWFAVAILAFLGQIRRSPIFVKTGRVEGAPPLQARASLENF